MGSQRFETHEKVQLEVYGQAKQLRGHLKNLSATGALLQVFNGEESMKRGDLVNLIVLLDKLNTKRVCNAEVIWADGSKVGIAFVSQDRIFERMMRKLETKG